MPETTLPADFSDLEPWTAWALETEKERSDKRQASNFEELKAFYDVMLARTETVLEYLDKLPLDKMPPDARQLLLLTLSLAEVAPAIEQFGQVQVVDGYDINRIVAARRE